MKLFYRLGFYVRLDLGGSNLYTESKHMSNGWFGMKQYLIKNKRVLLCLCAGWLSTASASDLDARQLKAPHITYPPLEEVKAKQDYSSQQYWAKSSAEGVIRQRRKSLTTLCEFDVSLGSVLVSSLTSTDIGMVDPEFQSHPMQQFDREECQKAVSDSYYMDRLDLDQKFR